MASTDCIGTPVDRFLPSAECEVPSGLVFAHPLGFKHAHSLHASAPVLLFDIPLFCARSPQWIHRGTRNLRARGADRMAYASTRSDSRRHLRLRLVQREGGPIEEIHPGDVVWFSPGEKHWHGATQRRP